jgi:5-(carboxyamino)imidazole ribonucleotide mutase
MAKKGSHCSFHLSTTTLCSLQLSYQDLVGNEERGKRMSGEQKEDRGALVGILMGSPNDQPVMQRARDTLERLGVPCELLIRSAHRMPEETAAYARSASGRGVKVIIAGAGMAAHLAGAVAAHTLLPVVGVPLVSGALGGQDALYATVQMPGGIPVATVAINGAENAAYLAAQILALSDPELAGRLRADREERRKKLLSI